MFFYSYTGSAVLWLPRHDYMLKTKGLANISSDKAPSSPPPAPSGSQPQVQRLTISSEEAGQRIDNYLLRILKGVPKSHVYRILRSGEVRVNKGRISQTYRLETGDELRLPPVRVSDERKNLPAPAAEFEVLLEDASLLVINKPAGVAVHGGSGVSFGVIEQLRSSRPQAKFLELVHRLDRDTSGILLLAKKRSALRDLHQQIREGAMDKRYLALVHGVWRNARQHVKLPLHKYTLADGERRVRVQADGQAAHTIFNLVRPLGEFSLLEAELITGRTHQIRVHLAANGFPIAGDDKYGDYALNRELQKADGVRPPWRRMFLHAYQISFAHPDSGERITLSAPLPQECTTFLEGLAQLARTGAGANATDRISNTEAREG